MNQSGIKYCYPVTADDVVNIYDIIYGDEDKIKFTWYFNGKEEKARYSKIRKDKDGREYFKAYNHKIYLDMCLMVNVDIK